MSCLKKDLQFHPEDIFKNEIDNPGSSARIGMVVDLTKSYRFYDKEEIVVHGCIYKKIPIEGHGQSPTKNPNDIIAVHCTHGFNRTGFLIIAYLVEECGYALDMAVQEFSAARPDGIYKQGYLDDLCQRYGDGEAMEIKALGRPLWESGPVEDTQTQVGKSVDARILGSAEEIDSSPKFMDGLKLSTVEGSRVLFRWGKNFPGSQPVSLEESPQKQNMSLLATLPYMVSWKADGMRYLVLIDGEDQIYAFDRDFNVFHIPKVKFPHRESERSICNTLVDAEMIIERVQDEKGEILSIPRLLIYDLIWFENTNIGREPFWKRFEMVKHELIDPLIAAMRKGTIRREDQLMSIRRKDFYLLEATHKLFDFPAERFAICSWTMRATFEVETSWPVHY
uniref:Tyrosine specific protein phosphatases domain-containing protein n=1 Tax=Ditylenchus dipsaci TaxID=166011 RepID=A0A915CSP3_9BILA